MSIDSKITAKVEAVWRGLDITEVVGMDACIAEERGADVEL